MRTKLLPRIVTWNQYVRVFSKRRVWLSAIRHIVLRHRLSFGRVAPTFPGTCVVFMIEGRDGTMVLVKLFPPTCKMDIGCEATSLSFLKDRTKLNIPNIVVQDILRDQVSWPYLILKPIDGSPVRDLLTKLSRTEGEQVAIDLGRFVKRMHAASQKGFALSGVTGVSWRTQSRRLITRAIKACRRTNIFEDVLKDGLETQLTRLTRLAPGTAPVLLHADITEDHVMLVRKPGQWKFNGLIDFADARKGDSNYELMPIWFDTFKRKPNLFRKYHSSYAPRVRITEAWRDRALAFSLLHIFGPGVIANIVKQESRGVSGLTWGKLRDWLWPKSLEGSG